MIIKCKSLILGATFYGLSLAVKNSCSSIVIERTFLPGREFVDSLSQNKKVDIKPVSCYGKAFKSDMLKYGLLSGSGDIYAAPSLYILCEKIKEQMCKIYFGTQIKEISKESQGYKIVCFSKNIFFTVFAQEIVDTTSEGVFGCNIQSIARTKMLNVLINSPATPQLPVTYNGITGCSLFEFETDIDDGIFEARKSFYAFFENNREKFGNERVIFTANTFAYKIPYTANKIDENHVWIPSCGFDNLLHAIDQGQVM